MNIEPKCSTDGCERRPEAGRSRCRTCRRAQTATKQAMHLTRYSERLAPDGTLLGINRSYIPSRSSQDHGFKQAQPVNVTVQVRGDHAWGALERAENKAGTTALILPDPQIGWRQTDHGLEPFHDAEAMAVTVQMAAALQPDVIVHLGDFLDFAPFSRFTQEPGFRGTTQAGIDAGYRFLAELRAVAPGHRGVMLEGNHDKRISDTLAKLAPELARLRRADDNGWPVMSLPGLLRLDEVGVQYYPGYPANEVYLSPKIRCIHGNRVASSSSTAALLSKDARANTLFGHVHRMELHHRTVGTFAGPQTIWVGSPGTLARTDGSVPSFHGGSSVETGASLRISEDWQAGCAVVSWIGDEDPILEMVRINNGRAVYRGVAYSAPTAEQKAA